MWGQRFTDHGDAGRANQFRAIPEPNFDDVHDSTARTNTAGAFTGGGVGNKAIFGVFGHHQQPIGALESISFTWRNVVGPGGPFYNPPTAGTVLTPYVNLIVDFNPLVPGNLHVVVLLSDSLSPSITQSIGSYANPAGANELTYSWSKSQNVLLANTAPNAAPGGVTPQVTVGPQWLDNSFRWADLVAINPQAVLVDAFPNDGGLPAGAVLPAILLVSGDSGNVSRSGKKILRFLVNGTSVL